MIWMTSQGATSESHAWEMRVFDFHACQPVGWSLELTQAELGG